MSGYFVVFQYTAAAGADEGNRYMTLFESGEQFLADCGGNGLEQRSVVVVAAGVSLEEAHRLCDEVSLYIKIKATQSEYPDDPEFVRLIAALMKQDKIS